MENEQETSQKNETSIHTIDTAIKCFNLKMVLSFKSIRGMYIALILSCGHANRHIFYLRCCIALNSFSGSPSCLVRPRARNTEWCGLLMANSRGWNTNSALFHLFHYVARCYRHGRSRTHCTWSKKLTLTYSRWKAAVYTIDVYILFLPASGSCQKYMEPICFSKQQCNNTFLFLQTLPIPNLFSWQHQKWGTFTE